MTLKYLLVAGLINSPVLVFFCAVLTRTESSVIVSDAHELVTALTSSERLSSRPLYT